MGSITTLIPIVIGYLLGAIPAGLIVARCFGVRDIRKEGSGNIGATNVWRVVGPGAAIWVYVFDIGKGVVALLIARQFDPTIFSRDLLLVICAVAVVLGNIFPVYLSFKGGKGVNTSLGAMLVLLPWETLICVAIFILVVWWTRFISLGSIVGALSLCLILAGERFLMDRAIADVYLYLGAALALVILLSHRQNIRRLVAGTENRFSLSSKTGKAGSHV